MALNFNGRTVVVTGAGSGLGRVYALMFAARGANVVVNDLGGSRSGEGKSSSAADNVVDEIRKLGGVAVADYNSVVEGEKIIQTALENYGRIDVLVNNAGILRDKSFARISDADWDIIQDVHVKGAFKTTRAAWPHFKKQNYGRVIFTSSNSGLYGNFGQANYSSAKMALIGLCNTLAIEGRKNNIHCNVIVPTAASRLTEDILPPEFFRELKPELIAPVVGWLCHELCEENSSVIEAAAGWASKYCLQRGQGSILRHSIHDIVTLEDVKNKWKAVTDMSALQHLSSIEEASGSLMNYLEEMKANGSPGSSSIKEPEGQFNYDGKFCILYALGIGASTKNEADLKYLYENHEKFSAFPTIAVIPGQVSVMSSESIMSAIPGRSFGLSEILHGEQYLEIYKPFPTSGKLKSSFHVADVLDKGKHAVILCNVDSFDESGEKIVFGQMSVLVVGAGGFGGKRESDKSIEVESIPKRAPDCIVTQNTSLDQAALYRLTGDVNPLHIDPSFAALGGYDRPILHGLCTLGFSARHVMETYANNDPALFKAIKVRFASPVFPGDTIKTEMWKEGCRIHFQTSTNRGKTVIAGAYVDLHKVIDTVKTVSSSVSTKVELASDGVFVAMEEHLKSNPDILKKVNGVFVYDIMKGGKKVKTWTVNLKVGEVYTGSPKNGGKCDTTLIIDDNDMLDMFTGKLNPQTAFMKGKLKIKGNISMAQKLKHLTSGSKL